MKENKNTVQTTEIAAFQTMEDFKNSLIIVSVVVNLAILTAWLLAQASEVYAAQLISLL